MNGLPGKGPWRIAPACPAPLHNSHAASQGRKGRKPCICPRALFLKSDRNENRRRGEGERNSRFLYMSPNVTIEPMPKALQAGACSRIEGGQAAADAGMNRHSTPKGVKDRDRAKAFCEMFCPVMQECRAYVLANEAPAGSWGGVWGGLDPWNRRGQGWIIQGGKAVLVDHVV